MASLVNAYNIADIAALAGCALPLAIIDYLEGGADNEWTLTRNRSVFDEWVLAQHALVDVSNVDASADLLVHPSTMPLMLSPTGMSQLFHASGEAAVARAAAAAGVPYGLSTMAMSSIEAIALGADGCSIGRPYLYGLAARGEAGVARMLAIFRTEIERDMGLMGRTRIAVATADDVDHISQFRPKPGSAGAAAKPNRIVP